MKILWVKSEFLHPTERGGQIRTLETLRRIHQRHEVHYAAYAPSRDAEGPRRAAEYCTAAHVVEIPFPPRGTPHFFAQVIANLASPLPFIVYRYRSRAMTRLLDQLHAQQRFDAVVCDFLAVAANFRDLKKCVLFQHNVESMIFERHADQASGRLQQAYFASQARRTHAYEREACRSVAHVVAVSDADRESMQTRYGVSRITAVPTRVDVPFFAPRDASPKSNDLVFVGSMGYMPNVDAMQYFIAEGLPRVP